MVGVKKLHQSLLAGCGAVALMMLGSTGAWAQNCTSFNSAIGNVDYVANAPAGAASAVAGALGNVSSAFQTQQGSAFVAGVQGDPTNQTGGGFWVRGVGGVTDTKSSTGLTNVLTSSGPVVPGTPETRTATCSSNIHQTFAGIQLGQDITKTNVNGWNLTWGATAGYLEANGTDIAPISIRSHVEVPFIGTYFVATRGNFFADVVLRREFYNVTLNNSAAAINLNNEPFGARAWTVAAGAGYHAALQNGWFFEPSAGFIWSRTEVDAFTVAGPATPGVQIPGTLAINNIESKIGRATVRVGRSFTSGEMAWQPFASGSVFHEFGANVTSTFATCPGCAVIGPSAAQNTATSSTSRVGTYGQFSLGIAGQRIGTGWVGFVRGDYKTGTDIKGWAGNAGLRYNFVPDPVAPAGKMVAKGPAIPVVVPYNWTGFYVGGHFGIGQGRGHVQHVGAIPVSNVDPYISGFLAGGQVGYNWQRGRTVFGIELDASDTNVHGAKVCGPNTGTYTFPFNPLFLTCKDGLSWIATATARVGMTFWSDRALTYIKAGGAWVHETATVGCVFSPTQTATCLTPANVVTNGYSAASNRGGWTVGWGGEFGLTRNWTAKGEIDYISFANHNVTANPGAVALNVGERFWVTKIGVNYRFGTR